MIAIAAGNYHSVVLKDDGTVIQWGDTSRNQGTVPSGLNPVTSVAAGGDFTLVLQAQYAVATWGEAGCNTPVPAGSFKALASGGCSSWGVTTTGVLLGWGYDTTETEPVPAGITGVKAIAAGQSIGLALKSDGTVVSWGQSVDSSLPQVPIPTGLHGVIAIAAGTEQNLALLADGTVVGWGDNRYGQAVTPGGLTGMVAIAAGDEFSLGLKGDGTLVGWGYDVNGETETSGLTNVIAMTPGLGYGLALKSDSTVVEWGSAFGDGSTIPPAGLNDVIAIRAGSFSGLALKSDGTVVYWGGDLGALPKLANVTAISTEYYDDANTVLSTDAQPVSTVSITIESTGSPIPGISVAGDGCVPGTYTLPATLNWSAGASCTVTLNAPQAPTGTQYIFDGWADGNTTNPRTILTPAAANTYSASFTTQFELTTVVSPAGAGTVTGGGVYYAANSNASVAATANASYQFVNWTGSVAQANSSSTTVSMTAPQTVTANFQLIPTITLSSVTGPALSNVIVNATVGAPGQAFTGNLQFQVASQNAAGPAPVTGAGNYNISYPISQGVGQYPISAVFTSTSPTVASVTVGGATLTVTAATQTITWAAIAAQSVGAQVTLSATAPGGTVTFAGTASDTAICTVSGKTAAVTGAGSCTITASQAGNSTYSPATVSQTFTVNQQTQTITWATIPTQVVGTQVALSATAPGGPVIFAGTASDNGICMVSGNTATMTGSGNCTITASQAGNATYSPVSTSQTFSVNRQTQTITWTSIGQQLVGAQVALSATAPGGPVTFIATASDTGICTVSGNTASMTGPGSCTITASQAGNATYSPATVSQAFAVNQQTQTITWAPIGSQLVGAQVVLSATAPGGTVAFAATASDTGICIVSGNTATMTAAGSCTITASQAGNAIYSPVTTSQTFAVTKPALIPNFTITPIPGSETINRGVLAGFILELQSVNKFNGSVKLSCSGGPAGAICANLPQTVKVNGTALAVSGILFPANTKSGTYTMTFTGVSGSLTKSATASFTVK